MDERRRGYVNAPVQRREHRIHRNGHSNGTHAREDRRIRTQETPHIISQNNTSTDESDLEKITPIGYRQADVRDVAGTTIKVGSWIPRTEYDNYSLRNYIEFQIRY